MRTIQICIFVSALLLSACQSTSQSTRQSTAVEDNMGKAVAQMKRDQVSNSATLIGPNDAPVEGIDPEYATNVLEVLRKDVSERSAVKRDVLINIGTQQQAGGNQ